MTSHLEYLLLCHLYTQQQGFVDTWNHRSCRLAVRHLSLVSLMWVSQLAYLPWPNVVKTRQWNSENPAWSRTRGLISVIAQPLPQPPMSTGTACSGRLGGTRKFSTYRMTHFMAGCVMRQQTHRSTQLRALQPPLTCSLWEQGIATTLLFIPLGTGP